MVGCSPGCSNSSMNNNLNFNRLPKLIKLHKGKAKIK